MISIEINNQQTSLPIDEDCLRRAAQEVLTGEGLRDALVSVAVVDDPSMHALNRRHLNHDYPTDVLSFLLEESETGIEGEIILSGDTAIRSASGYGWDAESELVLYLIHGLLHLVGYDDHSPEERSQMRSKEQHYLKTLGRDARFAEEDAEPNLTEEG